MFFLFAYLWSVDARTPFCWIIDISIEFLRKTATTTRYSMGKAASTTSSTSLLAPLTFPVFARPVRQFTNAPFHRLFSLRFCYISSMASSQFSISCSCESYWKKSCFYWVIYRPKLHQLDKVVRTANYSNAVFYQSILFKFSCISSVRSL